MKCKNCGYYNNDNANFCYACGDEFSDEDRAKEAKKGFYGKLRFLSNLSDWSDHHNLWFVKLIIIVGVASFGVYNTFSTGSKIALNGTDNYSYYYDKKTNTYQVYSTEKEVVVDLKIPTITKKLDVELKDKKNIVLKKSTVDVSKPVTLKMTDDKKYYKISYDGKHEVYIYVINQMVGTEVVVEKEDNTSKED